MSHISAPSVPEHAFALHLKVAQRRDQLLSRAQCLHQAGKIRQAGRVAREAQTIQRWLTALEFGLREGRLLS
jgi:hypothetical protein